MEQHRVQRVHHAEHVAYRRGELLADEQEKRINQAMKADRRHAAEEIRAEKQKQQAELEVRSAQCQAQHWYSSMLFECVHAVLVEFFSWPLCYMMKLVTGAEAAMVCYILQSM